MRITEAQLSELKDALDAARLERCGVKQEAQDAMRGYLESWVADRIASVIEQVEKTRR